MHIVFLVPVSLVSIAHARRSQAIHRRLPNYDNESPALESARFANIVETGFQGRSRDQLNELTSLLLAADPAPVQRYRSGQGHGFSVNQGSQDLFRATEPRMILPVGWAARTAVLTGASTVASTAVAVRQARKRSNVETELAELQKKLVETELAEGEASTELAYMKREEKKLKQKLEDVKKDLAALREEKASEEKKLNEKRRELAKEVEDNQRARRAVETALKAKEKEADILSTKLLEEEEGKLRTALATAEIIQDELGTQYSELQATLEALSGGTKELKAEVRRLKVESSKAKAEADKANAAVEKKLSQTKVSLESKTSEAEKLASKVRDLEKENKAKASDAIALDREISLLKTRRSDSIVALEKKLSDAQAALETKTAEANKLAGKVKELEKASSEMTSKVSGLSSEIARLKSDSNKGALEKLSETKVALEAKTNEARKLVDEALSYAKQESKQASRKGASESDKVALLTKQLSESKAALDSKTSEFEKLKIDMDKLKKVSDRHVKIKASASTQEKSASSSATADVDASNKQVSELKAKVAELQAETKELKSKLGETKAMELAAAQDTLKSVRASLTNISATLRADIKGSEEAWKGFDAQAEKERIQVRSSFESFDKLTKEEALIDKLNARRASLQETLTKLEAEKVDDGMMGWWRSKQIEWEMDEAKSDVASVAKQANSEYEKLSKLRADAAEKQAELEAAMATLDGQLAERGQKLAETLEYSREELSEALAEARDLEKKADTIATLLENP